MPDFYRIADFISYLLHARGKHGVHSPFVYHFVTQILESKSVHPSFHHIELTRAKMLGSRAEIMMTDLGAAKKKGPRALREIAANTAKQAKYGRLLYRVMSTFQPEFAVELGSCTGISTMYQAAAMSSNPLYSIEGDATLASIARANLEAAGLSAQAQVIQGSFEQVLPALLREMPRLDYLFADGNHSLEATLHYFELALSRAHEGSIFIFDDIHWSDEMKRAWNIIQRHKEVRVSIDIFAMGLIFFRKEQEKEHFILRY
jgi:predicted O-methyltransferase YrrM